MQVSDLLSNETIDKQIATRAPCGLETEGLVPAGVVHEEDVIYEVQGVDELRQSVEKKNCIYWAPCT